MASTLVVIGAGPKAVAIAAKAYVLRELGVPDVPNVVSIDRAGIAANWDGSAGFTDGRRTLGTPPEKDLGFPYRSTEWSERNVEVNDQMLRFSWQRYKVVRSPKPYMSWIDRGKPNPQHNEWSDYLRWAAELSKMQLILGEVVSLSSAGSSWTIGYEEKGVRETITAEAVVVTGPGDPRTTALGAQERLFDSKTFWIHWKDENLPALLSEKSYDVCVIGAGETAASIVEALLGTASRIFVVSPHGFVYSRGESFLENQVFTNPINWDRLTAEDRLEFIRRADRGVFSQAVQSEIDRAIVPVTPVPGRAEAAGIGPSGGAVAVNIKYAGEDLRQEFDFVVNAGSADRLWFTKMFDDELFFRFCTVIGRPAPSGRRELQLDEKTAADMFDFYLRVRRLEPSLHLPMLAGLQRGPGFPNLSCLGLLSDRILKAHV